MTTKPEPCPAGLNRHEWRQFLVFTARHLTIQADKRAVSNARWMASVKALDLRGRA